MPTIPGALLPWIDRQYLDGSGIPLGGGSIQFYAAGTTTPKDTFADATLETANTNPVILDGDGRATIFLEPGAYDCLVYAQDDTLVYSVEGVEDIGQTFLASLGVTFATGSNVTESPYDVIATDNFLAIDTTGGDDPFVVNLPAASERGLPLGIKNLGDIEIAVTSNGSDTIDDETGAYTLPAADGTLKPSIWLVPNEDGSGWWILASHGIPTA